MRPLALLLAASLAGCAATADQQAAQAERSRQELARTLAGRVQGKPETCLPTEMNSGPRIIAPDTLVYSETRDRLWVTRAEGCTFLRPDDIVVAEIWGGRMCRNDQFRTIQRTGGIPSPICRFGDFVPWQREREE